MIELGTLPWPIPLSGPNAREGVGLPVDEACRSVSTEGRPLPSLRYPPTRAMQMENDVFEAVPATRRVHCQPRSSAPDGLPQRQGRLRHLPIGCAGGLCQVEKPAQV